MKISSQTLLILKNFQTINKSLFFPEGNELRTIAESGSLFATATIEEEIPKSVAIYELSKLISVLGLYDEPELKFGEQGFEVVDSSGKRKTKLIYTEPSLILKPPSGTPKIHEIDIKFQLNQEDFASIMKASSSLGLTDFVVKGDGENLYVGVDNIGNQSSESYYIELGECEKQMRYVFDIASLKFLNSTYDITIGSKKVLFDNGVVKYFIALNSTKTQF